MQPPRPVRTAVKLMYVAAGLTTLGVVINLALYSSFKAAFAAANPGLTPAQLQTAEVGRLVGEVAGALVSLGLWLWMAWALGRGRNWARVVSSVFFGIDTLAILGLAALDPGVALIVSGLIWLIGVGVIVLIWSRASAPFYHRRQFQPGYPGQQPGSWQQADGSWQQADNSWQQPGSW
jgi:hypothetical protein